MIERSLGRPDHTRPDKMVLRLSTTREFGYPVLLKLMHPQSPLVLQVYEERSSTPTPRHAKRLVRLKPPP